jgi:hypothetical protein
MQMKNPWIKKNPLMSMWLSGANSMLGAARSQAIAQAKRQAATMMAEGTRHMFRVWGGAVVGKKTRNKKKTR